MAIFTGAGVAIITPMQANGDVNYKKLEEILNEQLVAKTDAIIICGTTGEASTLTDDEHMNVIRFAVKVVDKRVPVIAGTGSNCTQSAIALSREAEQAGADGLLIVTPYYNKATQKGLIKHFTAIAESVSIPIILYNVPARTGCNMEPATVAALAKNVENIVGIKEASGNIAQVAEMMALTEGSIDLYSGNDNEVLPVLSLGGIGVISVLSNIAPRSMHDMVMKFLAGDIKESMELQLKAVPLVNELFCEVNPIPIKKAMNIMGKEVGSVRMPLTEMEEANVEKLTKAMKDFGLKISI